MELKQVSERPPDHPCSLPSSSPITSRLPSTRSPSCAWADIVRKVDVFDLAGEARGEDRGLREELPQPEQGHAEGDSGRGKQVVLDTVLQTVVYNS